MVYILYNQKNTLAAKQRENSSSVSFLFIFSQMFTRGNNSFLRVMFCRLYYSRFKLGLFYFIDFISYVLGAFYL